MCAILQDVFEKEYKCSFIITLAKTKSSKELHKTVTMTHAYGGSLKSSSEQ